MKSQLPKRGFKPCEPHAVKDGEFMYDADGLTTLGFQRHSLDQIKDILFSSDVGRAIRDKTPALRGKSRPPGHKPWYSAQMSHYGINYLPTQSAARMKSLLKDAIESGECENVPDKVLTRERKMSEAWAAKVEKYEAEMAKWNREQDAVFQTLKSPLEEAQYDAKRFLSKYFLDSQGRPDTQKTPQMTILGLDYQYQIEILSAMPMKIQTLFTASAEHDKEIMYVIGWDQAAVKGAARAFANEKYEHEVKTSFEQHETLKAEAKTQSTFKLKDIIGSYVVQCEEIESQWGGEYWDETLEMLRLNINGDGHASFNFRVLEGDMYLTKRRPIIEPSSDSDSEEESEDKSEKESDGDTGTQGSPESETTPSSRKRKASSEASNHSARRQTKAAEPSRKVFFTWDGRETGEGEEQEEDDQFGCLRFDKTLTGFKGTMNVGFVGEVCVLKGFKVSHTPQKTRSMHHGGFFQSALGGM